MQRFPWATFVAAFVTICAPATAVARGAIDSAPTHRPSSMTWNTGNPSSQQRAAAQDAWLYVSGGVNDYAVNAYDLTQGGSLAETITQGIVYPGGMAIAPDGTLYVADGPPGGNVNVYPWGQTTPSLTIPIGNPGVPAIARNGDLWISTRNTPPSILVFHRGRTKPFRKLTSSLLQVPAEIIFDDNENLYVADNHTGVLFLPHGSTTLQSLALQQLDGCTTGLALAERLGVLFVSDCGGGTQVYAIGSQYPSRALNESFPADDLAIGNLDHQGVLFAPDLYTGNVALYRARSASPYQTLTTGMSEALGVLYKRPGIPRT